MGKGLPGGVRICFGRTIVQVSRGQWKIIDPLSSEVGGFVGTLKECCAKLRAFEQGKRSEQAWGKEGRNNR